MLFFVFIFAGPFFYKKDYFFEKDKFDINDNLGHEFDDGTHLELKISIRASICLNITSTALLGCPFVAGRGPKSMFRHKRSSET